MILNSGTIIDFDEDELKFFNLLKRHIKNNINETITDIDGLKKEMKQAAIPVNKLAALLKKMEEYILEDKHEGGQHWIELNSLQVKQVAHILDQQTCTACGKPTFTGRKIVCYCKNPNCGYERDKD